MIRIKRLPIISLFLFFFFLPVFAVSVTVQAQEVDVIRNGDFSAGLAGWVINPKIDSGWNPVSDGSVSLHPPSSGFTGTIIYQNLNVPGVGGKTFQLSMDLWKTSPASGNTVAVSISYVDTTDTLHEVTLINPSNADISSDPLNPTHLVADYLFPDEARKLVKIQIEKRSYGDFEGDNLQFSAEGVNPGPVPLITGLSSQSGNYGSSLTIMGQNFGSGPSLVSMGGSTAGVNVTLWSDASITATVQDPARSGRVCVVSDFVESNMDHSFEVTSPNYTITLLSQNPVVVKGQTAESLIRVDFLNDFTTQDGVDFAVQDLPTGATATFLPVPVKSTGGVLLRIDTTNVVAGDYQIAIQTNEPNTVSRLASLLLQVVTISDIKFSETTWDPVSQTSTTTYPTSKEVTAQGQLFINVQAIDSKGNTWTDWAAAGEVSPLTIQSSDPNVVGVYKRAFGPEIYALDTGTANIVVAASDGYQESLPVNVTLTPPYVTSISFSPQTVANTSTDPIFFQAQANDSLTSIGYDSSGMMNFNSDFFNQSQYAPDYLSVTSNFHLVDTPTDLGMVLFNASTASGRRVIPLYLVSDPSLSELKGGVRLLGDLFAEAFTLEFFDPSNEASPLFTRELFLMHGEKNFDVGGIQPGTYKLRLASGNSLLRPQWYPNADDFSAAAPVIFPPGMVDNIYFFLRAYPTISFAGSVKDGINDYPNVGIQAASVEVVDNYTVWSQTDAGGDFLLSGIRAGQDFTLRISKPGFTTVYSAIYHWNEDITALLPYGFFPDTQLAAWGVNAGNGMIMGRVTRQENPTGYLSDATVTAVDAANPQTSFPVTYLQADGNFGGTATFDNGVYAILNVPDNTTVKVSVSREGWSFSFPTSWLTVRAGAISQESFFGTQVPSEIFFAGSIVDINGEPVDQAIIEQAGAPSNNTASGADGGFTLGHLPDGTPFHLKMSKTTYAPTYTADMSSTGNITSPVPFTLFPSSQLANWGIEPGNGIVRSRVIDQSGTYVGGATVTAQSQLGQNYLVCYSDACSGLASTDPTSGGFIIKNVLAGDVVTVTAHKEAWVFSTRVFHTYAGGISQGRITGQLNADEAAVRAAFAEALDAYNEGNVPGFMIFVSQEFLDDGMNRSRFEAEINEMVDRGEPLAYAIQSVVIEGDQAAMELVWNGLEADVLYFRKEEGSWMLFGNQKKYDIYAVSGHHQNTYWVNMTVGDEASMIQSVTVTGPGISISEPVSLTYNETQGEWQSWTVDGQGNYQDLGPRFDDPPPATPLLYNVTITEKADPSSPLAYTSQIGNFVEIFATPVSPASGQIVYGPGLVFTWSGEGLPAGHVFKIELNGVGLYWDTPDLPLSTTSVEYDGPGLVAGDYSYNLQLRDLEGNFSMVSVPFHYVVRGDLNHDGLVTLADLLLALQVTADLQPTGLHPEGDANGDGRIDIVETIYILQSAANLR